MVERDSALAPYAAYRTGLAALVLGRLIHRRRGRRRRPDLIQLQRDGDGAGPSALATAQSPPAGTGVNGGPSRRAKGTRAGGTRGRTG